MTERVSIIEGKRPVVFVAPHGPDDFNTALVAEHAALAMRAYAVINWGWERDDKVDSSKDKANCNSVEHCHEDVVKEEFLDPIFRFRNRIARKHGHNCYIFYIHGVGEHIHHKAPDLDMIVGFGNGTPASLTCSTWMKNCFIDRAQINCFNTYQGKAGGDYAGWSRKNMNQLFRKWYMDPQVHSMQLELAYGLRKTRADSKFTGEKLALTVEEFMQTAKWDEPLAFFVEEI
jgi:hypothetical protein